MTTTAIPQTFQQEDSIDPTLTALSTLSLLDLRLSRLEHVLTGSSFPTSSRTQASTITTDNAHNSSVPTQLRSLEARLTNLKRLDGVSGSLVRMVDSLRREYPEIFVQTSRQQQSSDTASIHELSNHAHEVLANSTLYTTTSAYLQALQTLKIPSAQQSASLIDAAPRFSGLQQRQERLDDEIEELKGRSATLLEWWMKNGVVGIGELWEDWESRVKDCERIVRREERRVQEEMG